MWTTLIFMLLLVVVFWIFFIRPQSKKAKEAQKFRSTDPDEYRTRMRALQSKLNEAK